jgi:hypothetical protein
VVDGGHRDLARVPAAGRQGVPVTSEESLQRRLKIVVIDERNGPVKQDGSNLTVPEEGWQPILELIKMTMEDPQGVVIRIDNGGVLVAAGVGQVSLVTTKSEAVLSLEKALTEKHARTDNQGGDLEKGDHPVEKKFARVWDGTMPDGEQKPLKGY